MPVSPGQVFKPLVRLGKSPDDCWQWLGAKNQKGYPIKEINGRTMTAARWLWSQLFGPIPDELVVSMRCGDQACINPHHMQMMSVTIKFIILHHVNVLMQLGLFMSTIVRW